MIRTPWGVRIPAPLVEYTTPGLSVAVEVSAVYSAGLRVGVFSFWLQYMRLEVLVSSGRLIVPLTPTDTKLQISQQTSDYFHCARRQALSLNHLFIPVAIVVS